MMVFPASGKLAKETLVLDCEAKPMFVFWTTDIPHGVIGVHAVVDVPGWQLWQAFAELTAPLG